MNNLLIVYYDLGIGGVQRKIVDIANYLYTDTAYRETKVYILLEDSTDTTLAANIQNPNVIIRYKPFSRLPLWMFILFYIVWYRPISILAFLPWTAFYAYIAIRIQFWKKIRFVISEDVITSDSFRRGDFTEKINKQIPLVFSHADAIITPAPQIVSDLIGHYHIPKRPIHVLPNWTTFHIFPNTITKTIDCVYIGRLDREKRIPLLLSLISRIRKQLPDISLLIMGQGEEQEMIRRIIKTTNLHNNVTIIKPSPTVTDTLARAKLAVFCSESEGAPLFLVEAMALGLPVVALYFLGVEEIIANNKSGFICYNQAQFIRAVTTLLTNPRLRKSMGDYGKTIVDKRYAVSNINKYIDLLFPS